MQTFDWTSEETGRVTLCLNWYYAPASPCQFSILSSHAGWILSSFFFGYIITQVPGGWLAARFSGRWIFGIGIVMTAVLTLLTPVAADLSMWALIAVRAAEGFFEVCGWNNNFCAVDQSFSLSCAFRESHFLQCMRFGQGGHHLQNGAYSPQLLMLVIKKNRSFSINFSVSPPPSSLLCISPTLPLQRPSYWQYHILSSVWRTLSVWVWWRMAICLLCVWWEW